MRPKLINPVRVTIEPINRSSTAQDALSDEPFFPVSRGTTVTILAQVDELSENARRPGPGGAEVPSLALVTFTQRDLSAASYTPADGDRLTTIEAKKGPAWSRTVNWYLRGPRALGQGASGRPQLVQTQAVDRPPQRDTNEGL